MVPAPTPWPSKIWKELQLRKAHQGMWLFSYTYPENNVVAEKEVLVPAADLGIRVSVIVHLLRSGTCRDRD
jgi:hypothetical protein